MERRACLDGLFGCSARRCQLNINEFHIMPLDFGKTTDM